MHIYTPTALQQLQLQLCTRLLRASSRVLRRSMFTTNKSVYISVLIILIYMRVFFIFIIFYIFIFIFDVLYCFCSFFVICTSTFAIQIQIFNI